MTKLTYKKRKKLSKKEFALPGGKPGSKGRYPIEDKAHARNALARISEFGTAREKAIVRGKIHKKFPSIK